MPTEEQLERIKEKHGSTDAHRKTRAEKSAQEEANPQRDLDDAGEQERIMNPGTRSVTLSTGYKMTLNVPSLKVQKKIFGFCSQVVADAASLPGINRGLLPLRVISLLNARDDLESALYFWSAKLFGPAGTVSDEQAKEFASEIDDNSYPKDLAAIFEALSTLSGADFPKT